MPTSSAKKTLFLPKLNLFNLQESTVLLLASDPKTPCDLLDQIGRIFFDRAAVVEKIIENHSTPQETLLLMEGVGQYRPWIDARKRKSIEPAEEDAEVEREPQNLVSRIQQMNVAEKIRFALKGGREARALLIKDPNKQVSRSVLASPRITEQEVEHFAQSPNCSDEVLRNISLNRAWMRNYGIVRSLAGNPKTPIGIALTLIKTLSTKDLAALAKSRSISEALRRAAAKMLSVRQQKG